MNDFIAQFVAGEIVEPISGTMAGDQVFRIDLLQSRDDLSDVGIVKRRNDMETTDNCVHLFHSGHGLRLSDGVDHTAMAARCENDQTLALDDEVGADLVLEIVRMKAPVFFAGGILSGKHPNPPKMPTFSLVG